MMRVRMLEEKEKGKTTSSSRSFWLEQENRAPSTSTIYLNKSALWLRYLSYFSNKKYFIGGVADPGSGDFLIPGSGMERKYGSGSRMNIPDNFYESLETVFGLNILKFFAADPDPESGIFFPGFRSGMEKFGFGIPDPQHCL
jgi:hypothetical protein